MTEKALFILEYDVDDAQSMEQLRDTFLHAIYVADGAAVRPKQAHVVKALPALKILSVVRGAVDPVSEGATL